MSENNNIVEIKLKKSENFRQIYTIGAVGGHSQYDSGSDSTTMLMTCRKMDLI